MPRKLSSWTLKRAIPGRSIASGPANRNGSMGLRNAANGPSTPGGITRVARRRWTATEPSNSSTRSESKLFRTDQSMPLPIMAATSLADRTTESGGLGCFSRSIFFWVLERAFGVGAPTAVSVTGGSLVECGPNQRAALCRIGSRNHQAASAAPRTMARHPRRLRPLRKPFTVAHLVHRTPSLGRAVHQGHPLARHRLLGLDAAERGLEPGEIPRASPP